MNTRRKLEVEAPSPFTPKVVAASLPISTLWQGERRLESETYLTGGYGIRRRIETAGAKFVRVSELARVWQPPRLKGIRVDSNQGVPFITTNQAFDITPAVRKWLAAGRVPELQSRYLQPGWILITCSGNGQAGNVGKVFASYAAHAGLVVSHDLLRVQVHDESSFGVLYSFLRSRFGRAMLRSSQYGSQIKHLEPEHVDVLPVPVVSEGTKRQLARDIGKVFELRDEAFALVKAAERLYADEMGAAPEEADLDAPFQVSVESLRAYGRRLDAYHYNVGAEATLQTVQRHRTEPLGELTADVFVPTRFKHIYTDSGIPYVDSEDIFKVNPDVTKYIPPEAKKNADKYLVKRGWLLMACSGQIYGINGSVVLADETHENKILSNHIIRMIPRQGRIRPGYLQTALGHPVFGRPLVLRWAFGSGVPEIAPEDLRKIPVPRLTEKVESRIADQVERACELRVAATKLEDAAVRVVETEVERLFGLE